MASENAKAVAKEVIENVRKGKKVNFQEIQLKHGYTKSSAKAMKAKETLTYQHETKPIVEQMEIERQRLLKAMGEKDLVFEEYKVMVDAIDKLTKNVQLLSGQATEKVETDIKFTKDMSIKEVDEYLKSKLNASP